MASRRSSTRKKSVKQSAKKKSTKRAAKKRRESRPRSRQRRQKAHSQETPPTKKRAAKSAAPARRLRPRKRRPRSRRSMRRPTARTIRTGSRPCGTTTSCSARTCRQPAARTTRRTARARSARARCSSLPSMANRWAERGCADDECRSFRDALADDARARHDRARLVSHQPREPGRRAARRARSSRSSPSCSGARRSALTYLVSHPGNYIDDRASGIRRNADAITEALSRVPGKTILCMETTAGSGTAIGSSFEDLAELIEAVAPSVRPRVAVCVDTCHMYSAGYDLVNAYETCGSGSTTCSGATRLRVMHLNDSKTPFNSRRDRHELIGEGSLGERAFRHIMNDERLDASAESARDAQGHRSDGDRCSNAGAATQLSGEVVLDSFRAASPPTAGATVSTHEND